MKNKLFNGIHIHDNFLSSEDHNRVLKYCTSEALYHYGESDSAEYPPTGLTGNITTDTEVGNIIITKARKFVNKKYKFLRAYVNCFSPKETTYYHTDVCPGNTGITFLYYPQKNWNINNGGETLFYDEENVFGVAPIENRGIFFNSLILHKATPFLECYRFTVAVKFVEII